MGNFKRDTAVKAVGEGRYRATLNADWAIWGPNGGYVSSIALRAIGAAAPTGHRPATFSVQYLSVAAFAPVDIEVSAVRQGRQAWCFTAAMSQAGKAILNAQAWTTGRTSGPEVSDTPPPNAPHWSALRDVRELMEDASKLHPFWRHIDSRPPRFLGPNERNPDGGLARNWYRIRDCENAEADPFLDASRALLFLDTMPWPTFSRGQAEAPTYIAPSLDLCAALHRPAPHSEWLFVETRTDAASGGLIYGHSRIWTEDGVLIASGGSQMLVVDRQSSP